MTVQLLPSQTLLQEALDYDAETGALTWKVRPLSHFAAATGRRGPETVCRAFNTQFAGKPAFTYATADGAYVGRINSVRFFAHRVIWKLVHGVEPDVIDHINGNPSDNRLANLRSGTVADNSRNYRKPPGKTSQYRGVQRRGRRFVATINKQTIGSYEVEADAARAYDAAARRLHGEFATVNFPDAALAKLEPQS